MCARIDRFINFQNFPLCVNDNSESANPSFRGICCTIEERKIATRIYQKRKVQLIFFGEFLVGIRIVCGDSKDLSIVFGKITRLITERADFCRSASAKIARIERQYNILFSTKFAQLVCFASTVSGDEIRSGLSDFYLRQHLFQLVNDIFAMCFGVNFSINRTDVSGFINDKSCPF